MPTYRWGPLSNTTSYVLERSVDKGLTFTNVTTIPHNFSGPNYDATSGSFFYTDGSPTLGEIIRLYGTNADGAGEPAYIGGEVASSPKCHIYGVVLNGLTGAPHKDVRVDITPLETHTATTLIEVGGVAAINSYTALGTKCTTTLYTNNQGQWAIDLVRGISVRVDIPQVGFIREFKVPLDRDVLNIVDAHIYRTAATHPSAQNSWFYFGSVTVWR